MKGPGALAVLRKHLPLLDDWVDKEPDAWDYEAVLKANGVTVSDEDCWVDGDGTIMDAPPEYLGWGMSWEHGCMHIGPTTEVMARKAAALFVSLWQRGVSASFADKLMDGFITYLERQENTSLTFLAEVYTSADHGEFFRVTREGFCERAYLMYGLQNQILEALGPVAEDEEIIVTFTKRKK
jgi:hypothetical protein